MPLFGADELFGDEIEGVVPRDRREFAATFGANAAQRMLQAVGVMNALGVARDLGANNAGRVGVVLRAADPADGVFVENLDFKRAGRRTIVRTG